MSQAPDFLPPRDRRRSTRWITTKSVLVTTSSLLVLLLTFSVIEKLRHPSSDNFGRLYASRERIQRLVPQAPLVTTPTPIVEGEPADPLSLDAARRQQYLDAAPRAPVVAAGYTTDPTAVVGSPVSTSADAISPPVPMLNQLKPGQKISISGGADGVKLDVSTATATAQAPPSPAP